MTLSLVQRSGLEAVGTAMLAFTIGRVGSSDLNGFEQAISIGLCLTLLIHVIGRFSGAHFNPAVTVLLTVQRYRQQAFRSAESWFEAGSYITAQ
ncbi:MAG: aquaporin, partial [Cyanobacteria bacterium]|nr:aquaporin [Cyanobacteriota bacterium]